MTEVANDLVIPFVMNFQTPLSVGMAIIVEGTVPPDASMFHMNFGQPVRCCCLCNVAGNDIAFSLSPHFDRRYIVRNSRRKNKWLSEENTGNSRFPLVRGHPFCLQVFVAEREFLVAINGAHYCSFRLRTRSNCINSLTIAGDVCLNSVVVRNDNNSYPDPWIRESRHLTESVLVSNTNANENPLKLPLTCILSRTLQGDDTIKIGGRIKMLPYSFLINLQSTTLQRPHPSILLHVNGRYCYSQKKNKKNAFVFNSWSNGKWGTEKLSACDSLPMPGSTFTLRIKCAEDHFLVTLNQLVILKFPYRLPLSESKVVYIQGDLHVHAITLEKD